MTKSLIEKIDAILPQTQCQACGYAACKPYANAIANNTETIDKCAPGGIETLHQLAQLTGISPLPFIESVTANTRHANTAIIREADCIGCTKCIQACPVDAILGSAKAMHTIIEKECTGCELCVSPCPMDCIEIVPISAPDYNPGIAKQRYENKQKRLHQPQSHTTNTITGNKKELIAAALQRIKTKQQNPI